MRAVVLLRSTPPYKRECFIAGLTTLGYEITQAPTANIRPGDVLLLWNRHSSEDGYANRFEAAGGTVLVAENGYFGTDPEGGKLFALARNHHNGRGQWNVGQEPRWNQEVLPWRISGEFIIILCQRGIGCPGVAQPTWWLQGVLKKLKTKTNRPIKVRQHPGNKKEEPYEALKGAHCAVTWGSGAAIKAIVAGVPVYHELKGWIGAPAAKLLDSVHDLEAPYLDDRGPMLHRLSYAQWTLKEITSGEAFKWVLKS